VSYLPPASDFQLELQDNEFWCFGNGGVVPAGDATAAGCDSGRIHHDNGALTDPNLDNTYHGCGAALPIRALGRTPVGSSTVPDPVTMVDPRPVPPPVARRIVAARTASGPVSVRSPTARSSWVARRCRDRDGLPRYLRVENVRIEIGTARPDERAEFGVDPNLGNLPLVTKRRKDSLEVDHALKIDLAL
jgi:hypothetical protein